MDLPYYLMIALTVAIFLIMYLLRSHPDMMMRIGLVCWFLQSSFFLIEYIVIRATTAPYDFLRQPMSDLGVTACGPDTYVLAPYNICSPYHLLMNWTFTLIGLLIIVGVIGLHSCWPRQNKTRIVTALWVIYGLSFTLSGIVPADVHFLWHTLASLPGMVVQIPALVLTGLVMRQQMPKFSRWTFFCVILIISALILLLVQPLVANLPGGLLQRVLYGVVFVWMTTSAIALWRVRA